MPGVVWCCAEWCGVWCCAVQCGVWHGTARCGAVRCGAVRRGAVQCGVVWYGMVWCGVVWCVPKALLPDGKGWDVYPRVQVNGRAMCVACALCAGMFSAAESGNR